MRVAMLAHEQFPAWAKTAVGILRYDDQAVTAVLDSENAGERVSDHVGDAQTPASSPGSMTSPARSLP